MLLLVLDASRINIHSGERLIFADIFEIEIAALLGHYGLYNMEHGDIFYRNDAAAQFDFSYTVAKWAMFPSKWARMHLQLAQYGLDLGTELQVTLNF